MQEDSSTGPAGLTLLKSAGLHLKADFLTSIKNSLTKAKFSRFLAYYINEKKKPIIMF